MGGSVSQVFRSGSALLSNRDGKVSETTVDKINTVFEILRANPKISMQTLEGLMSQIAKYENVLAVHDDAGYNLLQKSVGLNHIELVRWILQRHRPDVNRSPCSLPLHIACLKGYEECVELLLKHGGRIDTEARMCFPGAHCLKCEESVKYRSTVVNGVAVCVPLEPHNTKMQNAVCYAVDGDQIGVLNTLSQKMEEPWLPFREKKPLLHLACERGAWKCVQQLVITRSEEINLIKDEYYPIHQSVLHDGCFLELLLHHGASPTRRTCTQQMTLLHVVIVAARKSADDTQTTLRILLERGCKELINEPDSLGNTPLHALIVRYALEEARYGYDRWNKYEVLSLVRFLLQNGAKTSINQAGNSALACVFRHIRDWEMCYELLSMMMKEGGDPNIVGRDGSVPIMVCLVPLINKDQLHHYTHSMKVCFVNCIRILLQHGANPNCSYRCKLTPLHVLIFTVSENFTLNCDVQKKQNFDFIKDILMLLLQHGLDCNQTYRHVLQSVMDMVQNVRTSMDMLRIYELAKTLIQYGADPNELLIQRDTSGSAIVVNEVANHGDRLRGNVENSGDVAGGGGNAGQQSLRVSFRSHARSILFYYIVLITKKDFLLVDTPLTYQKIIYLLYYTMDHKPLYTCLKSLHNFYMSQVPNRLTDQLINCITTLYRRPRTLKQICRHQIYRSLGHRVALNAGKLNLPAPLRDYLLNFEGLE